MNEAGRQARIKREVDMLTKEPPEGVLLSKTLTENDTLEARIVPPAGSPYDGGILEIDIKLGAKYPFEPPTVRFRTRIYHPNVDENGRICLDSLKLPPAGNWRPSLNIHQILAQLRILLVEPGLSDPLMKDIADMYKNDRERFREIAREWIHKYAQPSIDQDAKRLRVDFPPDDKN